MDAQQAEEAYDIRSVHAFRTFAVHRQRGDEWDVAEAADQRENRCGYPGSRRTTRLQGEPTGSGAEEFPLGSYRPSAPALR